MANTASKARFKKRSNKTLNELLVENSAYLAAKYSSKSTWRKILDFIISITKGIILFIVVGGTIYYIIPYTVLYCGNLLDEYFGLKNVFIPASFIVLFLWVMLIGGKAKRHR